MKPSRTCTIVSSINTSPINKQSLTSRKRDNKCFSVVLGDIVSNNKKKAVAPLQIPGHKGDNILRQARISELITQFYKITALIESKSFLSTGKVMENFFDQAYSLAKQIFACYNFKMNIIRSASCNSVLKINSIESEDNTTLVHLIKKLISAIILFPDSFIQKLEIQSLYFCNQVELIQSKHQSAYNHKLLSGCFPLKQLDTNDKILLHLYKIITYALVKKRPSILAEWRKILCIVDPDSIIKKEETFELVRSLKTIMDLKSGQIREMGKFSRAKIGHLSEVLKEFDSVGINDDWLPKFVASNKGFCFPKRAF